MTVKSLSEEIFFAEKPQHMIEVPSSFKPVPIAWDNYRKKAYFANWRNETDKSRFFALASTLQDTMKFEQTLQIAAIRMCDADHIYSIDFGTIIVIDSWFAKPEDYEKVMAVVVSEEAREAAQIGAVRDFWEEHELLFPLQVNGEPARIFHTVLKDMSFFDRVDWDDYELGLSLKQQLLWALECCIHVESINNG